MTKKRAVTILAILVVLVIAAIAVPKMWDKPQWNPYLWEYMQRDESYETNEALKDELRQGLQDIGVSQSSGGVNVEVIQSFGTARTIEVLFKVTLPKEEIDIAELGEEDSIAPNLTEARFYKGKIEQEEIEGMSPYQVEIYHKKDRIALTSNPGKLRAMDVVEEENALICVLERSCYYDVYDDQLLTLIIQGFEVNQDGESKIILENNPIAVAWHSKTKGDIKYWSIDNGVVSGYAFLDSSHFCMELNADEYMSLRIPIGDIAFLDKKKEKLDIDLKDLSSFVTNQGDKKERRLFYLEKMVDLKEVQYLQIGDEIIKCD